MAFQTVRIATAAAASTTTTTAKAVKVQSDGWYSLALCIFESATKKDIRNKMAPFGHLDILP